MRAGYPSTCEPLLKLIFRTLGGYRGGVQTCSKSVKAGIKPSETPLFNLTTLHYRGLSQSLIAEEINVD